MEREGLRVEDSDGAKSNRKSYHHLYQFEELERKRTFSFEYIRLKLFPNEPQFRATPLSDAFLLHMDKQ